MIPYFLLILIPCLLSFVAVDRDERGKQKIYIGSSLRVAERCWTLPAFFLIFFLLVALRHESVGNDTANYEHYFSGIQTIGFWDILRVDLEPLYVFLNWCIGRFTSSYQIFLAITAAFSIFPVAGLYMEDRRHSLLKIVLFVNMSVFVMQFSGIRQCLAMAIGIYAYRFTREKKLIKFLLAVYIALLVHHSAFVLLLMYPIYHATFRRAHLYIIIPVIVAIYIFNEQIFGVLNVLLSSYSDKYDAEVEATGAFGMLILFVLFTIFSFVIIGKGELDRETMGLRNCLLLIVALQCFAPINTLAMRLNYYYILLLPMMIPRFIDTATIRYRQVAKFAGWVMNLFFAIMFLRGIWQSAETGISALNTVPYIPFWGA